MKKIFLSFILCLFGMVSFALDIKQEQKQGEFITVPQINMIYVGFLSNDTTYYLVVNSTNQFEDDIAMIFLGDSKADAIKSINDLKNIIALGNDNVYSIGQGYEMYGDGRMLHSGPLKYTAGEYVIQPFYFKAFIKKIQKY